MGMGFAPTWLRQVSLPLLHVTTLTSAQQSPLITIKETLDEAYPA